MKLKLKLSKALFSSLLITLAFSSVAQFQISGNVVDETGKALEGVDVFIHETHQGAATDSAGNYVISDVKKGSYHLHITYAGFHSQQKDVFVSANITNLNFQLEESINELHQVVIENSLEKSDIKNNPLQVVHLDKHYLNQQGGTSFMKNLEKLPGISALNNGVGVSKPAIRGLNGNRVVVTTDGIKQEGQQWGSDHGLEIDVNDADKIEIIKGAGALVYGSDAVGGVINIRPELPKGKDQFKVGQLGSYNSLNNAFRSSTFIAANKKNKWFKVRVSLMDAGDYSVPTTEFLYQTTLLPIYNNRLKNTAVKEKAINAYFGQSKNWGYWYFRAGYFDQTSGFFAGAFGVPNAVKLIHDNDYRDIDLPYQTVVHTTLSAHTNIQIKNNWLEMDGGYQRNQRSEIAIPHSAVLVTEGENQNEALSLDLQTLTLNARYFVNDSIAKKIVGFSSQYKSNQVGGYEFIIPQYTAGMAALYGLYKRLIRKNWKMNLGGRLEYNYLNLSETATGFYKNGTLLGYAQRNEAQVRSQLNWAAALGLNKEIKKELFLKVNTAKTSRMPQANELAANGLHHGSFRFEKGNPDLDMETAWQNDVSINYERRRWLIHASTYYNHFFNFIYLKPSASFAKLQVGESSYAYPEAGQLYTYTQSQAEHFGYEVELEYRIVSNWRATVSSEYTSILNTSANEYVPFVAPFSVKTGIEWKIEPKNKRIEEMHLDVNYGIYARQTKVPRNDIPTDGYQLLNAGFSIYFKSKWEINCSVQNALNTHYFSNLSRYKIIGIPEPGRSFVGTISYQFNKL